jgi:hypothetical protein
MFKLVLVLALLVAATVFIVRRVGVSRLRALFAAATRFARIRSGEYHLRDLHESMVQLALRQRIPGLHHDYLPNRLAFGWHPDDIARWSELVTHIAGETGEIIAERARAVGIVLTGQVVVTIVADSDAQPGRPTLRAHTEERDAVRAGVSRATVPLDATEPIGKGTILMCSLLVDRKHGQERLRLTDGLTVGRGPSADIRLPDATVSATHARFATAGVGISIVDLDSSNGTFVNGRRVEREAAVEPGDVITFGRRSNRVHVVAG